MFHLFPSTSPTSLWEIHDRVSDYVNYVLYNVLFLYLSLKLWSIFYFLFYSGRGRALPISVSFPGVMGKDSVSQGVSVH